MQFPDLHISFAGQSLVVVQAEPVVGGLKEALFPQPTYNNPAAMT